MKQFTLLINGNDVDTGVYEYFPFADKAISDFKATYRAILALKRGKDFPNIDEYIYAKYCVGTDDTNKQAIEAAYNASKEFRYFPVSKRFAILRDIHKHLVENKDVFIGLLVIEGHPLKMAEWEYASMELGYRKETLDLYKDELWKELGRYKNETVYWARKPDGVVVVSTPKNASASNSLIAGYALLGGNTLIIKPPLRAPIATIFLWKEVVNRALKENGAPIGTLNIILGNSKKITEEWITSPYVNDVLHFGDSKTGMEIGKRCFDAGKKPILELSGNDMLFVWKECDIEGALEASLEAFIGSTQVCMVPKIIYVHEDIYEEFISRFIIKVNNLKYGLPSDAQTCLSPVTKIDEFYEFLEDALQKGAKMICGGERVSYLGLPDKNGSYIQPTVLRIDDNEMANDMKCVLEENFFPLLPVIKVKSKDNKKARDEEIFLKMVTISNLNEYGLRMSVWVKSYRYIRKFIKCVGNSGLLRINCSHVALSSFISSHGGTGKTGGPFGELNYVWQKTTHLQGICLARERRRKKR